MKALVIRSTSKTPSIDLNPETGIFEICGRSIMENPLSFYSPILHWLREYILNPAPAITINIQLEYLNTGSTVCLFDLFKNIEELSVNKDVQVKWMYDKDDEDMLKMGRDFESMINLPIEFIPIVSK